MAYKAVLFDLDGTLVHTPFDYVSRVVGRALADLNLSSGEGGIRRFWYEPFRERTIREVFGTEPEIFWPVMNRHDTPESRMSAARPYGDADFVAELKETGYRTGIVTGARRGIIRCEVEMIGPGNFDVVIRAQKSSGMEPKPHPEGILRCLGELQVSPGEAMYVGNGPEDIEAAKAAGVLDVHMDRNEHPLNGMEPSVSISSLYELRPMLPPRNAP
ncbi:MAG: HAD family hydrolase [Candidatus Aenigmarchaeota archaeon]|nr:HAD family hydrolase [Candidatus Aenigmarchaeota archaeon]